MVSLLKSVYFSVLFHCSYVFSAPGKLLDSLPGTLMLTDCLEACQGNETCQAVNYETGLCVLFSANADQLPGKKWKKIINDQQNKNQFQTKVYKMEINAKF